MTVLDPTSVAFSLPLSADGAWLIDDIARLHAQAAGTMAAERLAPAAAPAARPVAEAAAGARPTVSGRYRSAGDTELELRVDVDGPRPTMRVSGDFFRRTGGTVAYAGSFMVAQPRIAATPAEVTIEGEGVFSFPSASPRLRVRIPRTPALAPPAPVAAQFLTSSGAPGATFACTFVSSAFRTLELEQDTVEDVALFDDFDTARLPSGGPGRRLSVPAAFAEAGIEMVDNGQTSRVPIALAGADRIWTDRELHHAMTQHFSRWTHDAAWRVWLLAATIHEYGPTLRGIMFDSDRRQGCAIFHDVVGAATTAGDAAKRAMLRTYVHELGHCFNLYHSHQKEYMQPPRPNRLDALSWMHYPDNFVGPGGSGAAAYWRQFPFQFDDEELVHLRHGFRDDVIPGGRPFGLGAADVSADAFAEPLADASGVALELRAPADIAMGAPVVVEIKLSLTDLRGRTVNAELHPKSGYVQIGIARPGGRTTVFRPFMTHCVDPRLEALTAERPAVYDSAYIGYGRDGFTFDAPGRYELRAAYTAPDGSRIVSNLLRIRIKPPLDREEEELADLFMGDDQGKLLYMLGSDSERLARGREAFGLVMDKYGNHPLADYARLVEGMNASRPFKKVEECTVKVRPADVTRGEQLLTGVVAGTMGDRGAAAADAGALGVRAVPRLDNISLHMVTTRLAELRLEAGDGAGAMDAVNAMADFLRAQKVPPHIQAMAQQEVAQLRALAGDVEPGRSRRGRRSRPDGTPAGGG